MKKTILGGAVIISVAIIFVQVSKQTSIERQQQAELRVKVEALEYQKQKDSDEKVKTAVKKYNYSICLKDIETTYDYNWSSQCKAEGKPTTCEILTKSHAEFVGKLRSEYAKRCLEEYKM